MCTWLFMLVISRFVIAKYFLDMWHYAIVKLVRQTGQE